MCFFVFRYGILVEEDFLNVKKGTFKILIHTAKNYFVKNATENIFPHYHWVWILSLLKHFCSSWKKKVSSFKMHFFVSTLKTIVRFVFFIFLMVKNIKHKSFQFWSLIYLYLCCLCFWHHKKPLPNQRSKILTYMFS